MKNKKFPNNSGEEIRHLNYNNNYITIITRYSNTLNHKMSKAIWGEDEDGKRTFIYGLPEQLTDEVIIKAFENYYNDPHRIGILYVPKEEWEYPFSMEEHISLEFQDKDYLGVFELDEESSGFYIYCYDTRKPKESMRFLNKLYSFDFIHPNTIKSLKESLKEAIKKCR